jgi:hypothetical protein
MAPKDLLDATLYLDRGYISDLYEVLSGESPSTTITKNQGKKAGAGAFSFSAEISAQETRSYPVSSFSMLAFAYPQLLLEPQLDGKNLPRRSASQVGWIEGELTVFKVATSVMDRTTGQRKTTAEDEFFQIRDDKDTDLALITTPEYFLLGLDTLLKMQRTLLRELSIPVRALVRVIAAESHSKQWVAIPLLIMESRGVA